MDAENEIWIGRPTIDDKPQTQAFKGDQQQPPDGRSSWSAGSGTGLAGTRRERDGRKEGRAVAPRGCGVPNRNSLLHVYFRDCLRYATKGAGIIKQAMLGEMAIFAGHKAWHELRWMKGSAKALGRPSKPCPCRTRLCGLRSCRNWLFAPRFGGGGSKCGGKCCRTDTPPGRRRMTDGPLSHCRHFLNLTQTLATISGYLAMAINPFRSVSGICPGWGTGGLGK
ncbi:hypothetical protein B0H67DRAFT_86066 [Lasiosphaeris hirsuta]|uniref:Uncharacterized protein n=1 Tax=Lasiosphaeris hirsuta TaxID=260670 RepID=A0AA40EBY8_9PEZI|nr:hypothetical protein B0H67DRAFT_86066 [Lasiosphaeris hirsuta]